MSWPLAAVLASSFPGQAPAAPHRSELTALAQHPWAVSHLPLAQAASVDCAWTAASHSCVSCSTQKKSSILHNHFLIPYTLVSPSLEMSLNKPVMPCANQSPLSLAHPSTWCPASHLPVRLFLPLGGSSPGQ